MNDIERIDNLILMHERTINDVKHMLDFYEKSARNMAAQSEMLQAMYQQAAVSALHTIKETRAEIDRLYQEKLDRQRKAGAL